MEQALIPKIGASGVVSPTGVAKQLVQPANGFDYMFDTALRYFESVAAAESNANQLTTDYIQGNADLEDVVFSINHWSHMTSLGVSVITTMTQNFKEIIQTQI